MFLGMWVASDSCEPFTIWGAGAEMSCGTHWGERQTWWYHVGAH